MGKDNGKFGKRLAEMKSMIKLVMETGEQREQEVRIMKDPCRERYGLTETEVRLMVEMAHCYPSGLLWKDAKSTLHMKGTVARTITDNMADSGFIRYETSSEGKEHIILTARSLSAFEGAGPFEPLRLGDFIGRLRYLCKSRLFNSMLTHCLKEELEAYRNSDFARGWYGLKAHRLSEKETRAFCYALHHFIWCFAEPFGVPDTSDCEESAAKGDFDALIEKGLLVSAGQGYVIAARVAETLLHGQDDIVSYEGISQVADIVKCTDITPKMLFFSGKSREEIGQLKSLLSEESFVKVCERLAGIHRRPSVQSLLWGASGTGKTETVMQIARETGRDIFLFNASKVTTDAWGGTEKLYRMLFDNYRYIVAVRSLTPILFINEADNVLSKRLSRLDYSLDKSMNTVSNLLLQEMENMHGILLATTNHVRLLDEAFDRRFLFKTELQKPNSGARAAIWRSMMPDLPESDAEILASTYDMSGSQINNVVAKCCILEVIDHSEKGLNHLKSLCEKELGIEHLHHTTHSIGFSVNGSASRNPEIYSDNHPVL